MIYGRRAALGAFGEDEIAEGTDPATIKATDGKWEIWCKSPTPEGPKGYERDYGGDLDLCLSKPPIPRFAPYTWIGNKQRWVYSKFPLYPNFEPVELAHLSVASPKRFAATAVANAIATGGVGAFYTAAYLPPFIAPGWQLAFAQALAQGGVARVWDYLLKPAVVSNVQLAVAVLSHGPAGAVMYGIRQEAEAMPDSYGLVKALALAIGTDGQLFEMIKGGLAAIQDPKSLVNIAGGLQKVVGRFQGSVAETINKAIVGFNLMYEAVAVLKSNAIAPENRFRAAVDKMTGIIFGMSLTNWQANIAAGIHPIVVRTPEQNAALKVFGNMGSFTASIAGALSNVTIFKKIGLDGMWRDIAALLQQVVDAVIGLRGEIATSPEVASMGPATPTAAAVIWRRTGVSIAPSAPKAPVKPKGLLAPVAAGAGGGFLIGGPPGALLGAGGGLIVGAFRRGKK